MHDVELEAFAAIVAAGGSIEDAVFTKAHESVDQILATTVLTALMPSGVGGPEFENVVMRLFTTIVEVEGLLAGTANLYPHREPEAFGMFKDLSACKEAVTQILVENGIVPLVINL